MFDVGAPELLIILVIVAMLFGVGRLPEIFGAVGKGIREFRKEATGDNSPTIEPEHKAISIKTDSSTDSPADKS